MNWEMMEQSEPSQNEKWDKLTRRINRDGLGSLPGWAGNWMYWNAGIHRLPGAPRLRTAYKYNRRNKKYGIQDPILVYQMGKVGSSSVYASLSALDLDVPVYQIHFLNNLDTYRNWVRDNLHNNPADLTMFQLSEQIRQEVDASPNRHWNIISLVRQPVPRGISGLFQNIGAAFPQAREKIARNELTAQDVADYFVNEYFDGVPLKWFDEQVKPLFGIDVYATEFPTARGYQLYEQGNVRMLVIRLEDLNRVAAEAMHDFLCLPEFTLINKNVGEEKKYAALYKEFLQVLKLTPESLVRWHDCQYARHFYTEQELAASVARWT